MLDNMLPDVGSPSPWGWGKVPWESGLFPAVVDRIGVREVEEDCLPPPFNYKILKVGVPPFQHSCFFFRCKRPQLAVGDVHEDFEELGFLDCFHCFPWFDVQAWVATGTIPEAF